MQFCSYIYLSLLQVVDFVNVIYSRLSFICLLLINHSDLSLTAVPLYLRQPRLPPAMCGRKWTLRISIVNKKKRVYKPEKEVQCLLRNNTEQVQEYSKIHFSSF